VFKGSLCLLWRRSTVHVDCTFYVRCMKTTTARCRPDQRAAVPVPHRIILYNLEKSFGGGGRGGRGCKVLVRLILHSTGRVVVLILLRLSAASLPTKIRLSSVPRVPTVTQIVSPTSGCHRQHSNIIPLSCRVDP